MAYPAPSLVVTGFTDLTKDFSLTINLALITTAFIRLITALTTIGITVGGGMVNKSKDSNNLVEVILITGWKFVLHWTHSVAMYACNTL